MRSGGGSQPWERYEGEGDERWQAFVVYRDQPSESEERSLREVGRQLGKSRARRALVVGGRLASEGRELRHALRTLRSAPRSAGSWSPRCALRPSTSPRHGP